MNELWFYHDNMVNNVDLQHHRYLYVQVDWSVRMIGIKGPRGTGKTTMMLQHIRQNFKQGDATAIYITMEHPYFFTNTLYDFTRQFYINGGRNLYVDEVHKYENWSRELKVIYDGFPDLRIVFSASSALDIFRGESDLSRRAAIHLLHGLSFREYLNFTQDTGFSVATIEDLFRSARQYALGISKEVQVIPHFKQYLRSGYYPFFLEMKSHDYLQRLVQVINTVIDGDLNYIEGYNAEANKKVKKLLRIIAESVPYKPNISQISRKTRVSRDLIYLYLQHLESANLISSLHQSGKGVSTLQKPDKLYLDNGNLAFALFPNPELGNLRETFVLNQLKNARIPVSLPKKGDFFIEQSEMILEVGGRNKGKNQIRDIQNAWLLKDDTVTATDNIIPLWLLGFLY